MGGEGLATAEDFTLYGHQPSKLNIDIGDSEVVKSGYFSELIDPGVVLYPCVGISELKIALEEVDMAVAAAGMEEDALREAWRLEP